MGKILKRKFIGFATCWTRPWWKFWIKIYELTCENERFTILVCEDCKNPCDNYKIWFQFRKPEDIMKNNKTLWEKISGKRKIRKYDRNG